MNTKQLYLIDVPPPTISGDLHIGHIFSYTQADTIARYQQYMGKELLYGFCFDNNGIPTQKLASKNGIWEPKEILEFSLNKGMDYERDMINSGLSFKGFRYHTFSDESIKIAYEAFELLKQKGIAYKDEAEFLYCTTNKTSISQSELDDSGRIERTGLYPEIKKGIGWFINIKDYIKDIKEYGDNINWYPEKYKKRFDDWCDGIEWNWSISRDRTFGIPIPGEENMKFDTWFISSLSPSLSYGSLNCPPFDLRYQSHDIIRTWAFYTIAMSYFINNQIPWKNIMITGQVLDGKGNKQSKSQGNATKPGLLLEQYGINGIKHWANSYSIGNDIKIDPNLMKMGYRMINKLTNAEKFLTMRIGLKTGSDCSLIFEWGEIRNKILNHLENFETDKALDLLYKYFWNTFCDKLIERCKKEPITITLCNIMEDMKPIFKIFYNYEQE
jgi:valyl-tRNA synthetase